MVGEEVAQEVGADDVTRSAPGRGFQRVGHKAQVLFQGLVPVGHADKLNELGHHVVAKVLVVGNGQHVVGVRHKGHVLGVGHLGQVVLHRGALVGQHQAVHVERVATKHAAHGVADERDDLVAAGTHVAVALIALRDLLRGVKDAGDRDVLVLDLDGHLALHVVDTRKDAIELLLVGAELLEAGVYLGLVGLILVLDQRCHVVRLSVVGCCGAGVNRGTSSVQGCSWG